MRRGILGSSGVLENAKFKSLSMFLEILLRPTEITGSYANLQTEQRVFCCTKIRWWAAEALLQVLQGWLKIHLAWVQTSSCWLEAGGGALDISSQVQSPPARLAS